MVLHTFPSQQNALQADLQWQSAVAALILISKLNVHHSLQVMKGSQ
jgi:hypothetical protein